VMNDLFADDDSSSGEDEWRPPPPNIPPDTIFDSKHDNAIEELATCRKELTACKQELTQLRKKLTTSRRKQENAEKDALKTRALLARHAEWKVVAFKKPSLGLILAKPSASEISSVSYIPDEGIEVLNVNEGSEAYPDVLEGALITGIEVKESRVEFVRGAVKDVTLRRIPGITEKMLEVGGMEYDMCFDLIRTFPRPIHIYFLVPKRLQELSSRTHGRTEKLRENVEGKKLDSLWSSDDDNEGDVGDDNLLLSSRAPPRKKEKEEKKENKNILQNIVSARKKNANKDVMQPDKERPTHSRDRIDEIFAQREKQRKEVEQKEAQFQSDWDRMAEEHKQQKALQKKRQAKSKSGKTIGGRKRNLTRSKAEKKSKQ